MRYTIALSMIGLAMLMGVGCADKAETPAPDRALADPMHYKPGFEESDISGGGLTEFNKKAFRRDVDGVFNP